ncbi:MAG: A/G-specific adenine glycosylase, partial [Candidatus Thermoplasmatota archaeon]|nr:A/G-specific adenine glycosylase [Candidatus Thermoplasmatota archaeon]
YTRQSPFEGSDRQIRGEIVRLLLEESMTRRELVAAVDAEEARVVDIIGRLRREHIVAEHDGRLSITRGR